MHRRTHLRSLALVAVALSSASLLAMACSSEDPPAERARTSTPSERDAADTASDAAEPTPSDEDASTSTDGGAEAGPEWVGPDGGISTRMNFFVTSRGGGKGGDFRASVSDADGLAGADALCASLANDVSPVLGAKTWVAYLSTSTVDARDRIGAGPYYNAKGELIANDVAHLHDEGKKNLLTFDSNLDELGRPVSISNPNVHDILTGTKADGTKTDNHCMNWTSSATGAKARLGHSNRMGGGQDPTSWNSAHDSAGCAEMGTGSVRSGGGRGSFYCFAK